MCKKKHLTLSFIIESKIQNMKAKELLINGKIVWALVIAYILIVFLSFSFKTLQWPFLYGFLILGIVCFIVSWVTIFINMVSNKIYNKTFWIITMLFIPSLSQILYLIQRKKLLRLEEKFNP